MEQFTFGIIKLTGREDSMESFFERQSQGNKEKYIKLLKITGSLSNLFSESENPFDYFLNIIQKITKQTLLM